jgi:hypothetical protein
MRKMRPHLSHLNVRKYQVLERKNPSALFNIAEGSRKQKGIPAQDCLLVQLLPVGFTACKHASNSGNNEADDRQAADDIPPLTIGDQ